MTLLAVSGASTTRGGRAVLSGVDLALKAGDLLGIAGPNGAGKSSLVRVCAGLDALDAGSVVVAGRALAALSRTERARLIGYLPQHATVAWPLVVRDVVALGRHACGGSSSAHTAAVERAMSALDLLPLAQRPTDCLSGGEQMRVHLARLLAGEHRIILADEPTASLDPRYQLEVMDALARIADSGVAVAVVLHDLPLAARYCRRLLILNDGRVAASGAPAAALSDEVLRETFKVRGVRHAGALVGFAPTSAPPRGHHEGL